MAKKKEEMRFRTAVERAKKAKKAKKAPPVEDPGPSREELLERIKYLEGQVVFYKSQSRH